MNTSDDRIKQFLRLYKQKRYKTVLKPILSPLELAAIANGFKPFKYSFEGRSVYVNSYHCDTMIDHILRNTRFFTIIIEKENNSQRVPWHLRDTFDDPTELVSLPAEVFDHLFGLEIYSLYKIMCLGKKYFRQSPGFDIAALQAIHSLFKKHNCGHLFK